MPDLACRTVPVVGQVPVPGSYRIDRGNEAVASYADTCFLFEDDLDDWELAAADLISDVVHAAAARGIEPEHLLTLVRACLAGDGEELLR